MFMSKTFTLEWAGPVLGWLLVAEQRDAGMPAVHLDQMVPNCQRQGSLFLQTPSAMYKCAGVRAPGNPRGNSRINHTCSSSVTHWSFCQPHSTRSWITPQGDRDESRTSIYKRTRVSMKARNTLKTLNILWAGLHRSHTTIQQRVVSLPWFM